MAHRVGSFVGALLTAGMLGACGGHADVDDRASDESGGLGGGNVRTDGSGGEAANGGTDAFGGNGAEPNSGGNGGTGGRGAGGSATGGVAGSGTGGSATGGSATGGVAGSGTGGSATGGVAGTGTAGSATGGVAGSGTGGSATGGVAGSGTAGSATGGIAGSSTGGTGTGGVAGSGTGGLSTGGTSTGGAGAAGGTGEMGGELTQAECDALEAQYRDVLAEAQQCGPTYSAPQCLEQVYDNIACGCEVPVNGQNAFALEGLAFLKIEFSEGGCTEPSICLMGGACLPWTAAECSPEGACGIIE